MAYVEVLLDRVRQADLELFKTKVEDMEKGHVQLLEEQGLFNIDMLVEDKGRQVESIYVDGDEESSRLRREELTNPKVSEDQKLSGEDMFTKFIQGIRG